MSSSTYPLKEAAALVITGPLAALINSQTWPAEDGVTPADMTPEEFVATYGDDYEAYESLRSKEVPGLDYAPDFEGTATPLKSMDDTEDHTIHFGDESSLCFIASDREPDLFRASYANLEELADEFQQKLEAAGFDLAGFPLEDYICKIEGTYFC